MASRRTRHAKEIRHGSAGTLFAEGIVWRRLGNNRLLGTHRGAATVKEVMGRTLAISEGTFEF